MVQPRTRRPMDQSFSPWAPRQRLMGWAACDTWREGLTLIDVPFPDQTAVILRRLIDVCACGRGGRQPDGSEMLFSYLLAGGRAGCGWRARVVRGPGKLPWSPRLLSRHVRGGATLGGMMTVSGGWWCLPTSPMTFSSSGAVWFFVLIWGRPRPRPPRNPLPQWSLEISNPSIIYYMPRSCCSNKLNLFKLLGRRVDLDLLYYPCPTVQEGQTDGDVNTPSNSRHQTQVIIGSTIRVPLTKFSSD